MARRLAVISAVAIASAFLHTAAASAQVPPAATPSRQLVVPFESDSSDPRAYWLTEASAVIVTDDLTALGMPVIGRDDRVRAFERLRVPAIAALSHATVIRLGQVVGASQVVVGRVDLQGDVLTVRARTIRLDVGRMSPEIVEEGPLSELFGIYARVARRIVPDSSVTLEQMEQDHPSPPAFEQYIKGLLAESPAARIAHLREALRLAPAFRRPRLTLWSVYHEQGEHADALAAVTDIPEGHRLAREAQFLAGVSMLHLSQHQAAFDTLHTLNEARPDPALLNNIGIVQLRRPAGAPGGRAVSYFGEAIKVDPSDPDLYFNLGYAYWLDRETASAISWLREAVRRNPADAEAHLVLGAALLMSGSAAEGAREKELARRLSSDLARFDGPGGTTVPRGLARIRTDLDVPASLRVESAIVEAGQRDQRELASFHLEAARRHFDAQRDREAIAELQRVVYLAPYQSDAHLLLGRLYLRNGRPVEAIDTLKISIWSEDTIAAHVSLAEAHLAAKDASAARVELELVLRRQADHVEAKRLLDTLP